VSAFWRNLSAIFVFCHYFCGSRILCIISILKLESVVFFKTVVSLYQITKCHNPAAHILFTAMIPKLSHMLNFHVHESETIDEILLWKEDKDNQLFTILRMILKCVVISITAK